MIRGLLRGIVHSSASGAGLRIMKYPQAPYKPFSPLDLAMAALSNAPGADKRFVMIGANDGIYGDHLYKYTDSGLWQGVLVEPQPDVFERLKANLGGRAGLNFENLAIANGLDSLRLYCAPKQRREQEAHASTVTSFDRQIVARQLKMAPEDLDHIDVPCMSLTKLVEKHGYQGFSVLVIDCEGADLEVLSSLDFQRFTPLVIQFEHGHLTSKQITAAVSLLSAHGYQVNYGGFQHDTVAIHRETWQKLIGFI